MSGSIAVAMWVAALEQLILGEASFAAIVAYVASSITVVADVVITQVVDHPLAVEGKPVTIVSPRLQHDGVYKLSVC